MKSVSPAVVTSCFIVLFGAVMLYSSGIMTSSISQVQKTFNNFHSSPIPTQTMLKQPVQLKKSRKEALEQFRLAQKASETNDIEKMKKHLLNAIQADQTYAAPYEAYGLLMGVEGNYEEGKNYFQTAIDLDPDSASAAFGLGIMYASTGENKLAEEWLRYAHTRTDDIALLQQIEEAILELQ